MIFEDKENKAIIVTSYDDLLQINLWCDDMSFNFMTFVNYVYRNDTINWLKNNIYHKWMIAKVDLNHDDFKQLIGILKSVAKARLEIGPIGQPWENERLSEITVEKWTGINDEPNYTLGIKAHDHIKASDADFLVEDLLDMTYNYNEVLELVEQWEKLVESE